MRKVLLGLLFGCSALSAKDEILPLTVISYELFKQEDAQTLHLLKNSLYEMGIVGIRGVPGYQEKLARFIETARLFAALPEEVKDAYAPNRERGDLFLGYEKGKEKFRRPDGRWVVDDLKVSYYAFVPDTPSNIWPAEVNLRTSYQELGCLMAETGKAVMEKMGIVGPSTGIFLGDTPQVGRMLYYRKSMDSCKENPYWCGAHFDHGLFTVLTPASYFAREEAIAEPEEAGLFVKVGDQFKKVKADPEIMIFQVGEFGQLATDDAIRATEHCVHKASGLIERFAMAVFFDAPLQTVIRSFSELTQDARYGGKAGEPCSYQKWHEESFKRYIVNASDSENVENQKSL